MRRTHNQLRRILTLIDALSPLRMPFNTNDAIHLLAEKSGSHVDVCERTIQRDLELLVDMNFAHVYRKPIRGTRGAGKVITEYQMDLVAIANVQRAAMKATLSVQSGSAPSNRHSR